MISPKPSWRFSFTDHRGLMMSGPNDISVFSRSPAPVSRASMRHTYRVRLATSASDVQASQALRFTVFNLELREGLAESFELGLDQDSFDRVCDHLLVEEVESQKLVGSYRLQTGSRAGQELGYYSAQEFDFAPYESIRSELIELGRACVDRDHRHLAVLVLLWRGIAAYARNHQARYLIGCSSVTSQKPAVGASVYRLLQPHLAEPSWRTVPLPELGCALDGVADEPVKVPKLLSAYLTIGAKICGPPAIDRAFKTIDFLTFLDLESVPARTADRYLRDGKA